MASARRSKCRLTLELRSSCACSSSAVRTPFDTQALYNTSLWYDSAEWLELLYSYDERSGTRPAGRPRKDQLGQLDYLLGNAVDRTHVRRVEWLLRARRESTGKERVHQAQPSYECCAAWPCTDGELLANAGCQKRSS